MGNNPIESALRALTRAGFEYAILRNAERALIYPQQGDLDIVVPRGTATEAVSLLLDGLNSMGWVRLRQYRKHYRVIHLVVVGPDRMKPQALRIDVIEGVGWGPFALWAGESVTKAAAQNEDGISAASIEHQAAAILAGALLYSGHVKKRYQTLLLSQIHCGKTARVLERLMGSRAAAVRETIGRGELDLSSWRMRARWGAVATALASPISMMRDLVDFVGTAIGRIVRPPGWLVVAENSEMCARLRDETQGLVAAPEIVGGQISMWRVFIALVQARGLIIERNQLPKPFKWCFVRARGYDVDAAWGR